MHYMDEHDISLAVIAEPYRVPPRNPQWAESTDGRMAVTWRRTRTPLPCTRVAAGDGFVMVRWGKMLVMGVYLSPRLRLLEVEEHLDRMTRCIGALEPAPIIVCGDFNAHSEVWGSRRNNARGRLVLEWADSLGLILQNQGVESTCVRPQGESIVDLTWATSGASRGIRSWKVLSGEETLSDHVHIEIVIETPGGGGDGVRRRLEGATQRRWASSKLDEDRMIAALMVCSWPRKADEEEELPLEQEIDLLNRMLGWSCDVAMPRHRPRPRKAAYWWTEAISELRKLSIQARRRWTRARRGPRREEEAARALYREAKKQLCRAIGKAKSRAWEELLQSLNKDPWGLAYKIVREKLRGWSLPVTERLDPGFLEEINGALFPDPPGSWRDDEVVLQPEEPVQWQEEWAVTEEEVTRAIRRMNERHAAPGPDGYFAKVIFLAYKVMGSRMRRILTRCLREGSFPAVWRRANLVLLHKEGKPEDSPSAYRPICLLDELGKALERVIAGRIASHLSDVGPDLHPNQFGFRRGISTIDAILHVKSLIKRETEEGRVMIAVSLDIRNAFNSLPWEQIRQALVRHEVPEYLRRVIGQYLSDRRLRYRNREGETIERRIRRGVPQGSVLGPLLWDLGYNGVLIDVALPPDCSTVCYADDTVVLAAGENWREARSRASEAVAGVVRAIRSRGLEVAPQKTEIVIFHDGTWKEAPKTTIGVGDSEVESGPQLKYLGLVLDEKLNFERHFTNLGPRLTAVTGQCSRLMPNLGGPEDKARKLYATAVHSVALYGAPVWASEARASKRIRSVLRVAQRRMAIRAIRGYRTVSYAGATTLAGFPPLELLAGMHAEVFLRTRRVQRELAPRPVPARTLQRVKIEARQRLMLEWRQWLDDPTLGGAEIRETIAPILEDWVNRGHGHLTFRATQILTGHGCFGRYLSRIGRDETPACHHCTDPEDSPWHTLGECEAWAEERRALTETVGQDLDLTTVTRKIVSCREAWSAFAKFCEAVMLKKEDAERARRGEAPRAGIPGDAPRVRGRPIGNRRRPGRPRAAGLG